MNVPNHYAQLSQLLYAILKNKHDIPAIPRKAMEVTLSWLLKEYPTLKRP